MVYVELLLKTTFIISDIDLRIAISTTPVSRCSRAGAALIIDITLDGDLRHFAYWVGVDEEAGGETKRLLATSRLSPLREALLLFIFTTSA